MTFLDPVMGLTALAAGASLTLLWYFLKLRRRPVRVSSTALWSVAARDLEVNAPLRWIRPSWLLLLQLLAVAFLAGAVGRPALSGGASAPERWVLVIDRSASMSASDGASGGTRFQEAVERAEIIVNRMGPGERAMIVSFAGSATLATPMTRDRGVLRAALGSIQPTDQPGDLRGAIELVAAQLGETPAGARVVVLSDGGSDPVGVAAPLGGAELSYSRVGPQESLRSMNTGIVALSARRDPDDPALTRVFVRLAHAGAEGREATVSVRIGETRAGAQTLALQPGGEASAVFEVRRVEEGVLEAEIAGGDALESDDRAWAVVPPAWGAGPLVVSADGEPADPFLVRGLGVAARRPVVERSLSEWEAGLAPAASHVVFDRVEPSVTPTGPSLHVGAGVPSEGVRVVRYESDGDESVLAWDRSHPAMRYLALDALRLSGSPALEIDEDAPASVLAVGAAGPLIAAIESGGRRRLVLAFGPGDTNWETDPSFALFLALSSEWLAPSTSGEGSSSTTAEGVGVRAVGSEGAEVTASGPVDARATVRADGVARFGAFERAGVYSLEGAEVAAVAVNLLNAEESSLATRDELGIGGRRVAASGVNSVAVREMWRWFVVIAFALACIEWLIYAKKMRV